MGGRERNPNPAFQAFVTGIYAPTAEGGTAFFSPRLPPFFLLPVSLPFGCTGRIIWIENRLPQRS